MHLGEEKDRLFLMEICLHCADISNPYKPFNICAQMGRARVGGVRKAR